MSPAVIVALIGALPVILLAGLVVALRGERGARRTAAIAVIVFLLVILAVWGLLWLVAIRYNQDWS